MTLDGRKWQVIWQCVVNPPQWEELGITHLIPDRKKTGTRPGITSEEAVHADSNTEKQWVFKDPDHTAN